MKNLLVKEFKLAIHPLFYLVPLLGALVLIPKWPYFIALMYFFFITVPNIFTVGKSQNDIGFSVMLPVRKCDVVKARISSIVLLELLQIAVTAIFAAVNMSIYPNGNNLLDANISFIGLAFVMYGIFNAIFFPMFYKTAYKIGIPIIVSMAATIVFAGLIETLNLVSSAAAELLDGSHDLVRQVPVLIIGIAIFALLNFIAYHVSAKRFERIDL